jgi:precorrin-2 dehydrogenase/sirohydrochlorin ferrochelatase
MKYYPINLNLGGKKCVVIGGGRVAERRVLGLLECGAEVAVISPKLTPKLSELSKKNEIRYIERPYRPQDLKGAHLVVASTDNQGVNRRVCREGKKLGILVNAASAPLVSDFMVPSVVRRGDLMITISTSGNSPGLSKRLRIDLEKIFGEEYEAFIEILGRVRRKCSSLSYGERERIYREVATSDIPLLLREKRFKSAEKRLKKITGLGFGDIEFSPG